jgi:hypothetical protein
MPIPVACVAANDSSGVKEKIKGIIPRIETIETIETPGIESFITFRGGMNALVHLKNLFIEVAKAFAVS